MGLLNGVWPEPSGLGERYRAAGWWRGETFADDLRSWAERAPDRVAYVNVREGGTRTETVTFGRLADTVERMAGALWARGVRPGTRVAVQLPNRWEAGALWLACGRTGAVAVSVPHAAGPRERALILDGTGPALFVADTPPATGLPFARLLAETATAAPIPDPPRVDADAVCQLLCTSGTTGRPKAVAHTFNTRHAGTRAVVEQARGAVGDAPTATAADLAHALGLVRNLLSPLLTGVATVFLDAFDADVWLDTFARHRVAGFASTPVVLDRLAAAQRRRPRDLGALRQIISTGAPLPAPVADRIRAALADCLVNSFGMTESGLVAAGEPGRADAHEAFGDAVPGTEVRVADGRLHVRGPGLCAAMFDLVSGETLWDAATDDGWYDTGDLVHRDGGGPLRYLGRLADRIGDGDMIPVVEVEGELAAHPAVAEAAVIGVPGDGGHEAVCAVLVPHGAPPDPADLLADLRGFLAARDMSENHMPTRIAVAAALPRTGTGKVRKTELRERIAAGALEVRGPAPVAS